MGCQGVWPGGRQGDSGHYEKVLCRSLVRYRTIGITAHTVVDVRFQEESGACQPKYFLPQPL